MSELLEHGNNLEGGKRLSNICFGQLCYPQKTDDSNSSGDSCSVVMPSCAPVNFYAETSISPAIYLPFIDEYSPKSGRAGVEISVYVQFDLDSPLMPTDFQYHICFSEQHIRQAFPEPITNAKGLCYRYKLSAVLPMMDPLAESQSVLMLQLLILDKQGRPQNHLQPIGPFSYLGFKSRDLTTTRTGSTQQIDLSSTLRPENALAISTTSTAAGGPERHMQTLNWAPTPGFVRSTIYNPSDAFETYQTTNSITAAPRLQSGVRRLSPQTNHQLAASAFNNTSNTSGGSSMTEYLFVDRNKKPEVFSNAPYPTSRFIGLPKVAISDLKLDIDESQYILGAVTENWTEHELKQGRRVVQMDRVQDGKTVRVTIRPRPTRHELLPAGANQNNEASRSVCVSCIRFTEQEAQKESKDEKKLQERKMLNGFYITSYDIMVLLEVCFNKTFQKEEKGRKRRVLERFGPTTIQRGTPCFQQLTKYTDPLPVGIKKPSKVFKWDKLEETLHRGFLKMRSSPASFKESSYDSASLETGDDEDELECHNGMGPSMPATNNAISQQRLAFTREHLAPYVHSPTHYHAAQSPEYMHSPWPQQQQPQYWQG